MMADPFSNVMFFTLVNASVSPLDSPQLLVRNEAKSINNTQNGIVNLSDNDLSTLVEIAQRSGGLENKQSKAISDLTNRLLLLKSKLNLDGSSVASDGLKSVVTGPGRFENEEINLQIPPRWSDLVETDSKLASQVEVPSSSAGLREIQERRVDVSSTTLNLGQPLRLGGKGYGSYRGGRGRGGRGNPNQSGSVRGEVDAIPKEEDRPTKTWADVATMPSRSPIKLKYIPLPPSDDPNIVELPHRNEGLGKWESCLVGYFLDKKLPFNYIRNSAFNQWKNMGLKEVQANGDGFMFFIFDNMDACGRVLEGGPWYIGLSGISSKIGLSLFMDHLTSTGSRVSLARVCVEVNVDSPLPQNFFVKCEDEVVEIRVEYHGIPAKCEHCRVFGHDTKNCISNQVAQLVKMQKVTEEDKEDGWKTVKFKGKTKIGEPDEGEGSQGGHTPQIESPQHRENLIPEINNEVPLKVLHDETLGLAQVMSPRAIQIMDAAETVTLLATSDVMEEDNNLLVADALTVHDDA
ncbi:hypothetical protein ACSBR2_027544 [Camellia fascicularis]